MVKKFFLLCMAILLLMQGSALAKKDSGLPEEERIKVAVEIMDNSRHADFGTAQNLEQFLNEKLVEKNFVTVVNNKQSEEGLILDEDTLAEKNFSAENIGELLIFDAVELPHTSTAPENFNQVDYKNLGVDYVVRCKVLALGITKVKDDNLDILTSVVGTGLSYAGSGSNRRAKTLQHIGDGISTLGFITMLDITQRTALNTVVNMQFINVNTGEVAWEKNFVGQAIKHHNPRKGYDDVWTQAYMESIENAAKLISKRVNKYVDKVLIKGKSDKEFR